MERELIFLGTGGAEALPTPFCSCTLCQRARRKGGKDRRNRSMLRLSPSHCIDFTPDTVCASATYGDLTALEHVLVSHTHEDHFHFSLLEARAYARPSPPFPLRFYLAGEAFGAVDILRTNPLVYSGRLAEYEANGWVSFHPLRFGELVEIGGLGVLPLRGNHGDCMGGRAANYLLRLVDGRTLYYAVDTGWFLPETLEALKAHTIDLLVCECTWGARENGPERPDNHLDLQSCQRLFALLHEQKTLSAQSQVYLTHINHKQQANHAQLQRLVGTMQWPCRVTVAYDGLSI